VFCELGSNETNVTKVLDINRTDMTEGRGDDLVKIPPQSGLLYKMTESKSIVSESIVSESIVSTRSCGLLLSW
jgi:hypothetical protein